MADLTEPLDLPFIFIDPYLKIVDRAFPLECHKKPKQYLKYYSEDQVLKRTNDFRPTEFSLNKKLKKTSKKIVIDVPELGHLFKDDLVRLLRDDMKLTRKFERHDPLRENALVTMDFSHDLKLFIFASASSLSTLIIVVSKKEQFELDDSSVELPLDTMYIAETYDLEYPIRQITTSPFSSLDFKIFIVRTTSKLHLFTLDIAEGLRIIHVFDLAKTTDMFPSIDYSMPMHVEMSPYYPYQYLVVTTNGYTAIVDGTNSEILYNGMDPFLDDHNYTSRWKSCAFGKTPSTILIASPECIKEWEFTDDTIHKRTIAAPNDRIVAFTAKSTLYCFATIGAIILFDHLVPERPILKWTHPIRLGTPSLLTLNELEKDVCKSYVSFISFFECGGEVCFLSF
ncbi:MAG: hypothetical protein EXX96DRAFT_242634 [Benjaminiella poitrasii]|nr:MAG: hypothetical protein EXX96DRAFT_242634 [Benjaminiella poitrasii]